MIIGIDASRANQQKKTGVEWYSFYLIKHLAEIDKKNTYWLYLDSPARNELKEAVKDNSNFVFKELVWPFKYFWLLGRLSLEMIIKKPDVLFIPAQGLPFFTPKRTVNTIHDIAFHREVDLYSRKSIFQNRIVQFLVNLATRLVTLGKYGANSSDNLFRSTKFSLKRSSQIIAVSEFTKQEIGEFYPWAKMAKIKVIHNGYNDKLYKEITDSDKERFVLEKYQLTKPYFLYVGRLEKKKNILTLIKAFSLFKNNFPENQEKLVLVGSAGFGFKEIKELIEKLSLNDQVIIPGWIDEADMPDIYNKASIFVFPTKHEGFGIPVLEALACGLPTIVSDLPVLREVADEAVLFFNQDDENSIAKAMFEIISNHDLRQALKEKGLERVKLFSWHKCALETLKVLEKNY